ncbi:MAG: hypothetical protein KKA60_08225 [Proteobacteria bacterium]|nr:hypothetical protein [Pseudomonadota bacterium]
MDKRVKRHVKAKVHDFFAVTAPGLSGICAAELAALPLSMPGTEVVDGGVEFSGRLPDLYLANLCLATASRVLIRVAGFIARDFDRLSREVERVPWELLLPAGCRLAVDVSCRGSRLYHTGAVAERTEEAVARVMDQARAPLAREGGAGYVQRLFVRGVADGFVLSLDSSGELLHKRGVIAAGPARAPLRQTLAAAILRLCGYDGLMPLVDPMAGTGSFSVEAAFLAKNMPPGWFRDFPFPSWPAFSEKTFEHQKKTLAQEFKTLTSPSIFASDLDPEAATALADRVERLGFTDAVRTAGADFFYLDPRDLAPGPGLVVINPPYGLRLGDETQAKDIFSRVARRLRDKYPGWRVGLLSPQAGWAGGLGWTRGPEVTRLVHGGRPVFLFAGTV